MLRRLLGNIVGKMADPAIGKHLPHPLGPQIAGDRLALQRADENRQLVGEVAGEIT